MTQNQAPIVKAARADDVDALLAMARAAQPGMTNLPADPETLAAMLTASGTRMPAADGGTGATAALWFIVWHDGAARSEERRVGKACVRTCRSRRSPYH